ncbi:MAG: hypothetical protein R3B99_28735 [Polyangiales bacterium]
MAIVLRGEGPKGFCSGGDQHDIIAELFSRDMQGLLREFRQAHDGAVSRRFDHVRPSSRRFDGGLRRRRGDRAACDIRIGAKTPGLRLPLLPKVALCGADMGAGLPVASWSGRHGTRHRDSLTGEPIPAEEAYRYWLLNRVVEGDALREEADAFARKPRRGRRSRTR